MEQKYFESYKAAGVDIDAGHRAVELMRHSAQRTADARVLGAFGVGSGLYDMGGLCEQSVLVTSTDAVGTKLKIAFCMDRHDTVGIDCVAMCVNDLLCFGARPLFFSDYLAMDAIRPEKADAIVAGVAEGCVQSGCALISGKTAQMPGFYGPEQYDLAGTAVGVAERGRCLDGSAVKAGDVILGLASSGIHASGYSLVRKVCEVERLGLDRYETVLGASLGEVLLQPSRIYVRAVLALLEALPVAAIAHISKGGLYEHLPRALPAGLAAKVDTAAIHTQPIFQLIRRVGNIPQKDMFATFNMGVGMAVIVDKNDADAALQVLRGCGEKATVIGEVVPGEGLMLL